VFETDAGRPRYQQIAAGLRERILAGELAPGQRLPPEPELGRQFAASRVTVRGALRLLQQEGLLVARHGLGWFVRPTRVRQVLARLEPLDAAVAEQGLAPHTRLLDYGVVVAPDAVAAALALPAGDEVLVTRRLHSAHDAPLAYVTMYLPADLGARFTRGDFETHEHPLFELLPARLGITIGQATQTVRAEAAAGEVVRALGVREGTPVLVCERTTHDDQGQPIAFHVFAFRADRFEFRVNLSPHEWRLPWGPPGLTTSAARPEPPRTGT
jgi:GntR family transcriptional regulator